MHEIVMAGKGKNALGSDMMDFLLAQLDAANGKPILLTGSGGAFSAGLNLKEVTTLDEAGMRRFLMKLETVMARLFDYPAPTVALVNGHAIAGGCILALCCDYRVSSDDPSIRIGINEVALGLRFPPGILEIVRRRVPARALEDAVLGAGLHDPVAAFAMGFVDSVATNAEEAARKKLAQLAAHPQPNYANTKADLHRGIVFEASKRLEEWLDECVPVWTSEGVRGRLRAVLGK